MVIVESPIFTKAVREILADDEYASFQRELVEDPTRGDVIKGTGGLRKVRVSAKGKGKRGGARVIYYYVTAASQIRMLLIYDKADVEDLTPDQKRQLKALNESWK